MLRRSQLGALLVLAMLLTPGCALIQSIQTGKPLDPAQVRADLQVACTFDQMVPGGIATVGAIVSLNDPSVADQVALASQSDRLAHPAIQQACAAVPGQPQPLVVPAPGVAAPIPGTPIMLPPTS